MQVTGQSWLTGSFKSPSKRLGHPRLRLPLKRSIFVTSWQKCWISRAFFSAWQHKQMHLSQCLLLTFHDFFLSKNVIVHALNLFLFFLQSQIQPVASVNVQFPASICHASHEYLCVPVKNSPWNHGKGRLIHLSMWSQLLQKDS